MQQLIPVWVINLKKRPDRLQKIGNRLDQLGIKWQRIDAVDGLNCNLSSLDISAKDGEIGFLSDSTRACTASHYKFWEILISSKYKYGIVLEDDVEFSDDFSDLVCDESWIPNGANLIKLEKFAPSRASTILLGSILSQTLSGTRHIHRMYSRHTGAAAYLMSDEAAKRAIQWNSQYTVPVDHLLFNETVSKLCTSLAPLILVPPITWQSIEVGQGSNIVGSYKLNPISKRQKFFRSIKRAYYESRLWPYQILVVIMGIAKIRNILPK